MRIFFAGTPKNAADSLLSLHQAGLDIVGVLTRKDAAVGRKHILTASPVAVQATELGIKVIKANHFDENTIAQVSELKADLGVVIAYGAFVNESGLKIFPKGWINVHYSLLPKYRGAAPVQHAILNREEFTGVSIFKLDTGMDSGPLVTSVPTRIETGENSARLLDRLTHLGISALLDTIPSIAAGIAKYEQQPKEGSSFAPKISREDAKINWSKSAIELEAFINAMNPEPMAWTHWGEDTLRILSAREYQGSSLGLGERHVQLVDRSIVVGCGGSMIQLLTVQPAGKNVMLARDWYNGQKDKGTVAFSE
jgi:methionyl-tRNA formyltransferase